MESQEKSYWFKQFVQEKVQKEQQTLLQHLNIDQGNF